MRLRPGGGALLLGGVVLAVAVAFGSRPVGVAGVGLVLAGLVARVWAARLRVPLRSRVTVEPAPATEGDKVRLHLVAVGAPRALVGLAHASGTITRVGRVECRLLRRGGRLAGTISLGRLPRGCFELLDGALELGEPLGLETIRQPLGRTPPVVVHPRLVELESLFGDSGVVGGAGRRRILWRPAGFDFHSVREYEQGESLRRVHWPSTAKRGQLMVKELEDMPHEAVVVVLDCDPAGASGEPPDSSFDAAARVAGSVLRLYAARGRRARLVTTGRRGDVVTLASLGELHPALDVLAAAEPDAVHPLARALRHPRTPLAHAAELVVVTSVLDARAVDALVATATRRPLSVVWVDAPSFAGRPTRTSPGPLRLGASGVPLAVVRRGDDLRAALEAPRQENRAHG